MQRTCCRVFNLSYRLFSYFVFSHLIMFSYAVHYSTALEHLLLLFPLFSPDSVSHRCSYFKKFNVFLFFSWCFPGFRMGRFVHVLKRHGRRVQIDFPARGWTSITTAACHCPNFPSVRGPCGLNGVVWMVLFATQNKVEKIELEDSYNWEFRASREDFSQKFVTFFLFKQFMEVPYTTHTCRF